jgi:hypothetical protein
MTEAGMTEDALRRLQATWAALEWRGFDPNKTGPGYW